MSDLDALLARARLTAGHGAPVLLPPAEALALVADSGGVQCIYRLPLIPRTEVK